MAVRSREIYEPAELDDAGLARRAAGGDTAAFEELYRRHSAAAWGVAQAVAANGHDAADAVSEAFTRMLGALASGRLAPDIPFRPYLLVTTRNAAIDQHRRAGRSRGPEAIAPDSPALTAGPGERAQKDADAAFVAEAFTSLPERWRTVLWLTEVEGMSARDVGARLGLTANSAAQLAHRARVGLRQRYLQAHLRHGSKPSCEPTVGQLGAYVAGTLSPKATAAVDQHLADCEDCRARVAQLSDVGSTLRGIALPIPAALGAASLAHFHVMFPAAVTPKPGIADRLRLAPDRTLRSLSMSTGALLTAGVITAGLMSGGGGPLPVKGSRVPGGTALPASPPVRTLPAAPAPEVVQLSSAVTAAGPSDAQAAVPTGASSSPGATPSNTTTNPPGSTMPSPSPAPAPSPPGAPPPPSPAPQPAAVQVAASANLSAVTLSTAIGIGGGCTGTSVNGGSSCAPPAPAQPGVSATITTPLGTVGRPATSSLTKL